MGQKTNKHVTVEIIGGLGNQLFAFIAGKFAAVTLGAPLTILKRASLPGEASHESSLSSLDTGQEIETVLPKKRRLRIYFSRKFYSLLRQLGFRHDWLGRALQIHVSDKIGYDSDLSRVRPGYFVSGYFQTYEYHKALKSMNALPSLRLRNPSNWFLEESKKIARENPIVIHVRRGDYLQSQNDFIGALSMEYFLDAVNLLLRQTGSTTDNKRLWIFTDSPAIVSDEFGDALGKNLRFITPPISTDPAESLVLMSLASSIVISNSTFSWWAATLGRASNVVAPSKWFKNQPDPERLIPESWMKAESKWMK